MNIDFLYIKYIEKVPLVLYRSLVSLVGHFLGIFPVKKKRIFVKKYYKKLSICILLLKNQ